MSPEPAHRPIGVFDSGVGGLSVLREIRRLLPLEDLLYVADSGHAPYGDRSAAFIEARSLAIVDFLIGHKVKAIVVACNTASGVAIVPMRAHSPVPVIAMEPAVKPAAVHTRSGVIGVLATSQTLASDSVSRLIAAHGQGLRVLLQACPGLVEQVESGALTGDKTEALLRHYIEPLLAQGADTLVLGCTHYPFLIPAIRAIVGPDVTVIDPAPAVAQQLKRRLLADRLARDDAAGLSQPGTEQFWTSGALAQARRVLPLLWGRAVSLKGLPSPD
jgi:glutamate racemase